MDGRHRRARRHSRASTPGLPAKTGGICQGNADYVAAYQVKADTALPNTLAAIWSYPVRETWTALEITGAGDEQTLAVACAFHTDAPPAASGPLPGLISQSGNHRPALTALHPLSTQQLDGHVALPEALLLTRLRWPSTVPAAESLTPLSAEQRGGVFVEDLAQPGIVDAGQSGDRPHGVDVAVGDVGKSLPNRMRSPSCRSR